MLGHWGQGLLARRSAGGSGRSSYWYTTSAPLAVGGTQAVGACVPTSQDNHPLALGGNPGGGADVFPRQELVLLREVLHRQVDPVQVPPGYVQVPSLGGAARKADGVEGVAQLLHGDVDPHVGPGAELDTLLCHQVHPLAYHRLLKLELRYAQGQEAAYIVIPLEDCNQVAGPVELLGAGQARGAGAPPPPLSCPSVWPGAAPSSSLP